MNTEAAQAIKQSQYDFLLIPGTRGVKGEDRVFEAFAAVQEQGAQFKLVFGIFLLVAIALTAFHYWRTKHVSGVFIGVLVMGCLIGYQQGYASLKNPFPSMDVYQLHPQPKAKSTPEILANEPYLFRSVEETEEYYDITTSDGGVHQVKKSDYWIEKRIDVQTQSVTQLQLCLFDIDSD